MINIISPWMDSTPGYKQALWRTYGDISHCVGVYMPTRGYAMATIDTNPEMRGEVLGIVDVNCIDEREDILINKYKYHGARMELQLANGALFIILAIRESDIP